MGECILQMGSGINTRDIAPQCRNLTLVGGDAKIDVSFSGVAAEWLSLVKFYRMVAKAGAAPASPTDGVYMDLPPAATGNVTMQAALMGLTNDQTYTVRVYVRSPRGWQTSPEAKATATPRRGIKISTLPVGALIKDVNSKYYGVPIVWKIADKNHPGYPASSVTVIANKILCLKAFDAMESANSDSNRRSYGNNRYIYSNARRWLNSPAGPGGWYAAQHGQDAPPNNANVGDNKNEYDAEAGFLYGFSANMRAALLDTTHTVGKSSTDGGGTETCVDKIFFPSCTEVGLSGDHVCGVKLAGFSTDASRQAYPTAECVSKSEYQTADLSPSQFYYYWLCDAYASYSHSVRLVYSSGALSNGHAYDHRWAVRPLCNLAADATVLVSPDAAGVYILNW